MKEIHKLNLSRLTVLEFGQHIKSTLQNINLLGAGFITDVVLTSYLSKLNLKMVDYDKAMLQISKSDETAKIVEADIKRDNAISAATRQLSVFELSENPAEVLAYESLKTVFKTYGGIQSWNFEEESNGIDNLVVELGSTKYAPHIALVNMGSFVTRIDARNTDFKTLFDGRTQEVSIKVVYDTKVMRNDLKTSSDDMNNYVLSMAKAQNTDQYNRSLDVINTVRKYYSDLLAKRKPATKDAKIDEIPPMPPA
ncbi:MAG: hypothetical protein H7239_04375 [Flavobacterium sp.]|nr:hypothetical protein [Flavobacterium sp.]